MSLARLRDEHRKPFRVGAAVTIHAGWPAPYQATIVGCSEDLVKVQDEYHAIRLVDIRDIEF